MSEEPLQTMEALSPDTALRLISHAYRRALLDCLYHHDCSLALADAAEAVVEMNDDRPIQEIPAEDVKKVYVSLYHSHIPKLSDREVVQYEQERDLVSLTDRGEELVEAMDKLDF